MRWTSIVAHARFYGALLLALLLLLVAEGARAQAVPAGQGLVADSTELRVLRQLYAATGGPNWTRRDNWLQGTTLADAASWWGVTVAGGDVVGFYSDNNNLQGPLPAALGQLTGLTQLQFSSCIGLTGPLPREVGQLTRLQSLIFHFTGLSGALPAELGNLGNLTYLSLYTNRFSGALPPEMGRLAQLQVMYLGTDVSIPPGGGPQDRGNRFTGGVPTEWGQLTNLRVLELDTAPLGGAIPPELGQLVHLAELTFDTNGFTGPVPAELLNLPALTYLTLGYNVLYDPAGHGVLNGLTGLPAAAAVRNPGRLRLSVQKNYLDFGALEPYFTGPGTHVFAALDYRAQRPQPGADTVRFVPGQALTLRRGLGGARTHYQWQRQVGGAWQDVAGATGEALTVAAPCAADAGAYRVTGTNDWVTNLTLASKVVYAQVDRAPALTNPPVACAGPVLADAAPPRVAAAPADVNFVRTFAPRVALTELGVGDAAAPPATGAPAPEAPPAPGPTGTIGRAQWNNFYGAAAAEIPVGTVLPDRRDVLTAFEAGTDLGDHYGARVRGYLVPPATGDYTFWLASDDDAALWLSPDADPAHKAQIAAVPGYAGVREWDKFPAQRSAPVPLVAGQRYYVEALHREGAGDDHLAVAWALPDGTVARAQGPIAGQYLAPVAGDAAAGTAPPAVLTGTGAVAFERWDGVAGTAVADIPVATPPTATGTLPALAAPADAGDAYGLRLRGYLTAQQTGTYTFWLASDDNGELWLSPGQDPAGKVRLAYVGAFTGPRQWDKFPGQQSVPVALVAGHRYYLEALLKEEAGGDHLTVRWQLPDGSEEVPLAGAHLSPYVPPAGAGEVAGAVANPGFEADGDAGTLSGWTTALGAGTPAAAVYSESFPNNHGGTHHGTHYRSAEAGPYEAYTAQLVTGLAAGRYELRAWTKCNGSQDVAVLRAEDYGGARREQAIPVAPGSGFDSPWVPVVVSGIAVTNGQCRVGVYSRGGGGGYLFFDDVELVRLADAPGDGGDALTKAQVAVTTQYLDGLGRPVQTVQHRASPQGHDVVTPVAYDALGRQPQDFLPYAAAARSAPTAFSYRADARRDQYDFYRDTRTAGPELLTEGVARTGVAYSEKQFEASPLNRVLAQGAPGEAWALGGGHATGRTERPNTAADAVARFSAAYGTTTAAAHALAYQGSYPAGELWVTETTDEQQQATQTFTDKQGQVVAKQVGLGAGQWLTTGYVYDDFNRLRAVLPPKATRLLAANGQRVSPAVDSLLFYYRYDGRGRPLAKQVPGQAGEVLTVFDQLDRPVLSQDPAQRARNEWGWVKYDALGRAVLTGLVARTATADALQAEADRLGTAAAGQAPAVGQFEQPTADATTQYYSVTGAYPRLGQDGFGAGLVLTATYYDGYDFDQDGTADITFDTQYAGQFPAGQAPVADARVTGLATRTRTRVLGVADNDATQAAWLTTTTFYDDKARAVQVVATTARKDGQDVVTSQVDFVGQVLKSYSVHTDPRHAAIGVAETHTYDHAGRLVATRQQLPGEARAAVIDSLHYNEVGQLVQKQLAPGTGLAQDVDYAYNVRGWLTGLNADLVSGATPAAASKDLWGMQLSYDCGFQVPQFNGNIAGQQWRNKHDGVARAYGYGYDGANRLLFGDYVAQNTTGGWNAEQQRFALAGLRYDENGNILALQRRGLLANATRTAGKQFGPVDNLSYAYAGNRLQAVNDGVGGNELARPAGYHGAPTSLAGDFQEQGVRQAQEYGYAPNGSLTSDANKGITGIVYNHLSLPRQIHFGQGADSVVFRYTAAGQKVAKLVYQSGKPLVRTDYLGPYQYEGDSLRFFPHAEGRVLRFVNALSGAVRYEREFTLKDHLGNLRLAYRLGHRQTFTATLEQDDATRKREVRQFDSLSVSPPMAQAVGGQARTGSYVARLNAGGSTPQPLGPLKQLAVQKGDTVTVVAPGYYPQAVQNSSFTFSLAGFVASLLQQPAGAPGAGADGRRRGSLPLLSIGVSAALPALTRSGGVPQGYVRLLVFDADSNLLSSQVQTRQLSAAAAGGYETLKVQVIAAQDGYVTAYVGNESNADVYFDDVQVVLGQGLQVQETEYDPAGLELAGLVAPAPGIRGLNNYRFNGQEFQADLGLNWNHQDWRFFNPQLFTWSVVDPEVENGQEGMSPYTFGYDNAVRYADTNGRQGTPVPGYAGDNPLFYLEQGFSDIVNSWGRMIDKAGSYVNTTLSIPGKDAPINIGGGMSGKVASSTEYKFELKFAPNFGNLTTPNQSNRVTGKLGDASLKLTESNVQKIEVALPVRGLDVKAAIGTKIDMKTGQKSNTSELSVGKSAGRGRVSIGVSTSTDEKGRTEVKVGPKVEAPLPNGAKVSFGFGLYNTGK